MGELAIQEIVCCMGQPVAGNPSQFIMERAFRAAGLDWRYLTLEVAASDLEAAIEGVRAMGFQGVNLARPHPVAVIEFLDRLSESAELIGAVNSILRDGVELVGENSVGKGLVAALEEIAPIEGKSVVVLGAGATACAVAVELARAGAGHFTVVNRTPARGEALVQRLRERLSVETELIVWETPVEIPSSAEIVIQATSIGEGEPEARPAVSMDSLRPEQIVVDVVMQPARTAWLREAEQRGCRILDALRIFVWQRALDFRWWTGVDPDRSVMQEALEEFLEV